MKTLREKIIVLIENYPQLIENNQWLDIVDIAANSDFATADWEQLMHIVSVDLKIPSDIVLDMKHVAFEEEFMNAVNDMQIQAAQDPFDKLANSWSRFDYVMGNVTALFDFDYNYWLNYLLANQKRLGLKMRPLSDEYGWEGSGDYDLGWFNEYYFDKYFRDDEF